MSQHDHGSAPADPNRSGGPAEPATNEVSSSIYSVDASDPNQRLVDREAIDPAVVREITEVMTALGALRDAERELSAASQRYMRLNETDMRALHFLIVCAHQGVTATPTAIAGHLNISSASTTKLLDRLEAGGHVRRSPHPSDRRALAITVTPETHHAAMETVGRQQAQRFHAAARLTSAERQVVIRFLTEMANDISLGETGWGEHPEPAETNTAP